MTVLDRVAPWRTADRGTRVDMELDTVLDVLDNSRRRAIVRALIEDYDGQTTVRELSEHVAALESDGGVWDYDSGTRKAVYVALYQDHLPKLAGHGVVVWDNPDVRSTAKTEAVYETLERVEAVVGGEST